VETTKASKLGTQFSKLFFAPITKEILRVKNGRNAKSPKKKKNLKKKNQNKLPLSK